MFRSIIISAAVAGLVAGASAQQQMPAGSLQKVTNFSYGSYDFNSGFAVNGGSNRASGPDVLFSNIVCPAYYYGLAGLKQEWMDEGGMVIRGISGEQEVNGMYWEYCNGATLGYFNAVVNIYEDTVPFVGPAVWIPLMPSFADCVYGILGLPDNGCWGVTLDLSCGAECVIPQNAAGTYFGWSVTSITSAGYGPILGVQSCTGNGTEDLFEMRDWNGAFIGTIYTHVGTFWFGGVLKSRADFRVEFSGSPVDVQSVYGVEALDTMCLQADEAASKADGAMSVTVEGAPAGVASYFMLGHLGAAASVVLPGMGGSLWTLHLAPTSSVVPLPGGPKMLAGPTFGASVPVGLTTVGTTVTIQVVRAMSGAANLTAASNGLQFTVQP